MHSLSSLRSKLERNLEALNLQSPPAELYEPIRYTLELGGKRIRPLLVLMACDLFGGDVDACIKPAMAVEMFHNFTLLHDDIMDKASLRRGKETVNKKWNSNVAILSGDTMFVLAYELLAQVPPALMPQVLSLFTLTAREVCEGQQFDMNFENRNDVSISEYLTMIRLKTAVLLGCSLKLGALCSGAAAEDADHIYNFGINLGLGFQLQDDLLDVFGDEEKFGKEIGGDIVANKKTFLLLKALELAGAEDQSLLRQYYSDHEMAAEEKIAAVKKIYQKLNIDEKTAEQVDLYYTNALEDLAYISVEAKRKEELILLSRQLLKRDS